MMRYASRADAFLSTTPSHGKARLASSSRSSCSASQAAHAAAIGSRAECTLQVQRLVITHRHPGGACIKRVPTLRQGMASPPVYDKPIMRLKPSRQAGGRSRARRSARQRPSPRLRAAPLGACWAASRLVQYRRFQHWRDDGGSSSARLATDGRWHPPMSRPPRPASRAQLIGRFIADETAIFDARVPGTRWRRLVLFAFAG